MYMNDAQLNCRRLDLLRQKAAKLRLPFQFFDDIKQVRKAVLKKITGSNRVRTLDIFTLGQLSQRLKAQIDSKTKIMFSERMR